MKNIEKFALSHALHKLALGLLTLIALGMVVLPEPAARTAHAHGLSVDALVQPDGTLNLKTGASGSFDVQGWNLALDPQRGPVLTRQTNAVDLQRGPVAERAHPERSGAQSKQAAPTAGETWSALGNGVDGNVIALAVKGGDVYVGGYFTEVCGNAACNSGNITANGIARWDGSAWHTLGNGVSSEVWALAVSGEDVYVGGPFTVVCGNAACDSGNTTVNHIARWDGSAWHALDNGVTNGVNSLAVSGSDIYVGGFFPQVCGNLDCDSGNTTVNHLARWDGSTWHALDNGVQSPVSSLAVSGQDVYVGGAFTDVCGNAACNSGNITANGIARWDGSQWHTVGNGVSNPVNDVTVNGGDIYVGGIFSEACGNAACNSGNTTVNRIARWDGSAWHALDNGVNNSVFDLAVHGGELYVGGNITEVCGNAACDSGNTTMNGIARWDGSQWHTVGNGVKSGTYSLAVSAGQVYVGGEYTEICGNAACNSGNTPANRIAQVTLTPTQSGPTFVVNTNADSDDGLCDLAGQGHGNLDCTLREAIHAANALGSFDVIHFNADHTIVLGASLPTITDNVTLDAQAHSVVLDGASAFRILRLSSPAVLYLDHLTLRNGITDASGGALWNDGGSLDVRNSTFEANVAAAHGGAIYGNGPTLIANSTFDGNAADLTGGGVTGLATLIIRNSTFTNNQAASGAALFNSGSLTLLNSILAYSTGPDCTNSGTVASEKNNLLVNSGAAACGLVHGTNGDQVGIDPLLGILADHGGPTQTRPLLAGSPAINAADNATCAADPVNNLDQRGSPRPHAGTCDIGAFEVAPTDCAVKPAKPTLRKPAKNATVTQPKVKLDWNDLVCTATYKVTVKNTLTGLTVFKKTLTTPAASNTKTGVLPAGTYKWFVKACNAFGCSKSPKFLFVK